MTLLSFLEMNFNIKEAEMGNVFLYYYLPCCILCHGVWYILSLTRYVIESRAARNISSTKLEGMKRIFKFLCLVKCLGGRCSRGDWCTSTCCKDKWNVIRGMDVKTGKFLTEDRPGPDDWQKMAKSDRIIKKWSGDPAFSDTKLVDGLASVVVPRKDSKEETQLLNTQRAMGALGHMVLSATEGFSALYKKTEEFVNKIIGAPLDNNPEYVEGEENEMVPKYIFSPSQNSMYEEFLSMQREWQIDVSDPLANAARTAAAYHIKILANRRDKVISKVRTSNPRAATAISKIPPSSSGMFGGDATQLENVVKLAKNLASGSGKQSFQGFNASASSTTTNFRGRGGFRGGGNQGSFNKRPPKETKFGSDRGRGRGGNSRGRGR